MDFSLVKIIPSPAFDDIILPLNYALLRLGYTVEMRSGSLNPQSVNILFGTHDGALLQRDIPSNSIIFNLEQISSPSCAWGSPAYLELLKNHTVWDYSFRNARYLRKSLGAKDVTHVELGYVPEMTRLKKDYPQDIDVLFYGALNERREHILKELPSHGIMPVVTHACYGASRDHLIARAKIILNIHYYTPATLELPRIGYLLANSKAVVSEQQPETEMFNGLENACAYADYDDLIATVQNLLHDATVRKKQAECGFSAFSQSRQEDILAKIVGRKTHASKGTVLPKHLHVGSGKDFRYQCLNIDISPQANPDLVLDISQPLDPSRSYHSDRFGEIRLLPGSFSHITAFEVLEHVHDLPQTMRNLLDLLCDGGELELSVPHELSLGAWCDPTHVRAFNEMSWTYYCEWAWYMGWKNNRFTLAEQQFTLSDYGKSLQTQGKQINELLRTPRAIDGIRVKLRKRRSTPAELIEYDHLHRNFYENTTGGWRVG